MPNISPFDIEPSDIAGLGSEFTEFVNALLRAEAARSGLDAARVHLNSFDTVADGGVDAHVDNDRGRTTWTPPGETAWQFKRTDLKPNGCRVEIVKEFAAELLRDGASYRLALGAPLTARTLKGRLNALRETAVANGLVPAAEVDRIQVLDGNKLAEWVNDFPALTQSQLFHGHPLPLAQFEQWSHSRRHFNIPWSPDPVRAGLLVDVLRALGEGREREFRVHGPSGIGKTRLVMEAFRGSALEPLVVYVSDYQNFDHGLLHAMIREGRSAVYVVDGCNASEHRLVADQLTIDSSIRLISIGSGDDYSPASVTCPVWNVPPLDSAALDLLIQQGFPAIPVETRRIVVEHAEGNPQYAQALAKRVLDQGPSAVADLVERGDLRFLLGEGALDDADFLVLRLLALFERIGVEGERADELELVADLANLDPARVQRALEFLAEHGFLRRYGRYAAVGPDPLAVYLAASAWDEQAELIRNQLIPSLSRPLLTSLFRRAAALGRYEPSRSVLVRLLSDDPAFASVAALAEFGTTEFLGQFAIVAPEDSLLHIERILGEATDGDLFERREIRRELVWALERLVWHSSLFKRAADVLLRSAQVENESYGNNATGTWLGLFRTILPATAAIPPVRLAYLTNLVEDEPSVEVRGLVVRGCSTGLQIHESAMRFGELQGGSVVERRGSAQTWEEASEYRLGLLRVLADLSRDPNESVSSSAIKALSGAIHPLAAIEPVWGGLVELLVRLDPRGLRSARDEVDGLLRMRERIDRYVPEDERSPEKDAEHDAIVAALETLRAQLPEPDLKERLDRIGSQSVWDIERSDDLQQELDDVVVQVLNGEGIAFLVDWLNVAERTTAWFIGRSVSRAGHGGDATPMLAADVSPPGVMLALAGLLVELEATSDTPVFDPFVDDSSRHLSDEDRLQLTVRGPRTQRAVERLLELLPTLSVRTAAYSSLGWRDELTDEQIHELLGDWVSRVRGEDDYQAVLSWFSALAHNDATRFLAVRDVAAEALALRRHFPALGHEQWTWCHLSAVLLPDGAEEAVAVIFDLTRNDGLMTINGDPDSELLKAAATNRPEAVWPLVAEALLNEEDWRIRMTIRGWLIDAFPVEVIANWVGSNLDRARMIAGVAPAGGEEPTATAAFLLGRFGEDDEVAASLAAEYRTGSWVGPWSGRVRKQIEQMSKWQSNPDYQSGVRDWARKVAALLEQELADAELREAEQQY